MSSTCGATTNERASSYTNLLIWSETLHDVERQRIALEGRIRSAEQGKNTVDGGLSEILDHVKDNEKRATRQLERAMKRHPLGPWVQGQVGLGLKQTGRLLGAIGDPYVRGPEVRDGVEVAPARPRRGPAELWAYCGMDVRGGQAPCPRRGVQSNWNAVARMRIRLIAESCIKQRTSPYRKVYDDGRVKYDRPTLSAGHQHNRALRLVAKEILKDLYNASRELETVTPSAPRTTTSRSLEANTLGKKTIPPTRHDLTCATR